MSIIFKCDACGETADAPSSIAGPYRVGPAGWRDRIGRSSDGREIRLHVCGETCARRYDQIEIARAPLSWQPFPSVEDGVPIAHPFAPAEHK